MTGVQTCALPISQGRLRAVRDELPPPNALVPHEDTLPVTVSLGHEAAEFYRLEAARAAVREMLAGRRPWQPWGWRILNLLVWTRQLAIVHEPP